MKILFKKNWDITFRYQIENDIPADNISVNAVNYGLRLLLNYLTLS